MTADINFQFVQGEKKRTHQKRKTGGKIKEANVEILSGVVRGGEGRKTLKRRRLERKTLKRKTPEGETLKRKTLERKSLERKTQESLVRTSQKM